MKDNWHSRKLPLVSLMVLSLIWGTSYPILKIGVAEFPPFIFNALRQSLAGSILIIFGLFVTRFHLPCFSVVKTQIVPGILLLSVGQGFLGWSLLYLPSGLAALFISLLPIYLLIINVFTPYSFQLNRGLILGISMGAIGMILVFWGDIKFEESDNYSIGISLAIIAGLGWATSILQTQRKSPVQLNPFLRTGLQLFFGSLGLFIFSLLTNESIDISKISIKGIFSFLYLAFIGSVVGFSIYFYANSRLSSIQISLASYLSPLVAAITGWLFFAEHLSFLILIAFLITFVGMYVVTQNS